MQMQIRYKFLFITERKHNIRKQKEFIRIKNKNDYENKKFRIFTQRRSDQPHRRGGRKKSKKPKQPVIKQQVSTLECIGIRFALKMKF